MISLGDYLNYWCAPWVVTFQSMTLWVKLTGCKALHRAWWFKLWILAVKLSESSKLLTALTSHLRVGTTLTCCPMELAQVQGSFRSAWVKSSRDLKELNRKHWWCHAPTIEQHDSGGTPIWKGRPGDARRLSLGCKRRILVSLRVFWAKRKTVLLGLHSKKYNFFFNSFYLLDSCNQSLKWSLSGVNNRLGQAQIGLL